MIEVVKHGLGLCGENHPHFLNISGLLIGFLGCISYIKIKAKSLWKTDKK